MLSFGMLCPRADRIALRRRTLASGSPPPILAAMVISRASLLKRAPRFASSAPLKRLTLDHLLCPDMRWEFCLKRRCRTNSALEKPETVAPRKRIVLEEANQQSNLT